MDVSDVLDQAAALELHLEDPTLTGESRQGLVTALDQLRKPDLLDPPAFPVFDVDWGGYDR